MIFPSKVFLSILFVVLSSADASPLRPDAGKATLSFAARVNARGVVNIAAADRARAQAMKQAGSMGERAGRSSFSITNAVVTYTAQVGVGSPATEYTLLIDTGSSNTWIGANTPYNPTITSVDTGSTVAVSYGSGSFSGGEYTDTVTLSTGLVITEQSIGVASNSEGFGDVDGILGVGPTDLTYGTISDLETAPTVTDNLYSQGFIGVEALGIYFVPTTASDDAGELTFGGHDSSKITSSVTYVPLTTTSPASDYWGIDQSISYGRSTILSETAGIVDTGTTLVLIASDAFSAYQTATGAVMDEATGLLMITSSQYAKLQALTFKIGSKTYELTPNAQIWPRSLNADIGGSSDNIYLIVSDIGSDSGSGLDFINGYTFLQRHYSVFDTTNNQVGFATTSYTDDTSN
ncbi:aspartic peptidase domain-containing protein [Suillus subalutaceus]|uniref:aspartic peptidase domain-containing protein n=1 Tax=Suillus subalutaceus TaxID=48586 RepID=UPI001B86D842|nr:aspartic peptidase domain-containing protein [Suillus subalutaceus]KAG1865900.1 aspartic peptidase domain-containing protein [Suillus subalutaceus]